MVDPTGNFGIGSFGASFSGMASLATTSIARVGLGAAIIGGKGVSAVAGLMGRLAINTLKPIFRAVGKMPLKSARGRKITTVDKFKRFFVSPNKKHPNVNLGPIGRYLKKAFPNTKWEQHHVVIQAKWFRQGGPSQWYPRDALANKGLQRLGNAGFNLMSILRRLNNALGKSGIKTASLAIGFVSTVAYGVSEIINSIQNGSEDD